MKTEELLSAISARDVVAATLWAEARGETPPGRVAVANVIANRVKARRRHFGLDAKAVCLMPWQFSCWRPEGGKANHELCVAAALSLHRGNPAGPVMRHCVELAEQVVAGAIVDTVKGADHYLTRELYESDARPTWATGAFPVCSIGSHHFFRLQKDR